MGAMRRFALWRTLPAVPHTLFKVLLASLLVTRLDPKGSRWINGPLSSVFDWCHLGSSGPRTNLEFDFSALPRARAMAYLQNALEALPKKWQTFLRDNDLESSVVLANLLPGEVPEFEEAPAEVQAYIELAKAIEFRDQRRIEQYKSTWRMSLK